jgi:hypothetical protein
MQVCWGEVKGSTLCLVPLAPSLNPVVPLHCTLWVGSHIPYVATALHILLYTTATFRKYYFLFLSSGSSVLESIYTPTLRPIGVSIHLTMQLLICSAWLINMFTTWELWREHHEHYQTLPCIRADPPAQHTIGHSSWLHFLCLSNLPLGIAVIVMFTIRGYITRCMLEQCCQLPARYALTSGTAMHA